MTDYAVELRDVSKTYSSGSRGKTEEVNAIHEMNLTIPPGKFFTLLGPSGCGKTTTLRMIAGFEVPTSGEVFIQGQPMTNVPPNKRPVNTVFQNYALFPHMNVLRNVAFGPAVKRLPKEEQDKLAREALALVQLSEMADRSPSQLSGGQQQRVALARALVNQPAVLLLDEPLGALDLKLRKAMQIELKHIQEQVGITFVYVTHDQEEALTMSDEIAVMDKGVIQQLGDPATLYKNPANRFVADFIGESNFINVTIAKVQGNQAAVMLEGETTFVGMIPEGQQTDRVAAVTVRPEKVKLSEPGKAPAGSLSATINEVVYIGTDTRYVLALKDGQSMVARLQNGSGADWREFARGDKVKVHWADDDARILNE
jgi:spermidine/putrescine transport system ATP-binding protein